MDASSTHSQSLPKLNNNNGGAISLVSKYLHSRPVTISHVDPKSPVPTLACVHGSYHIRALPVQPLSRIERCMNATERQIINSATDAKFATPVPLPMT